MCDDARPSFGPSILAAAVRGMHLATARSTFAVSAASSIVCAAYIPLPRETRAETYRSNPRRQYSQHSVVTGKATPIKGEIRRQTDIPRVRTMFSKLCKLKSRHEPCKWYYSFESNARATLSTSFKPWWEEGWVHHRNFESKIGRTAHKQMVL